MDSTENYVRQVRDRLQVRPVLPLGLPLSIGSIGVLHDNRLFDLRGSAETILGVPTGEVKTTEEPVDWSMTSGDDVSWGFLANGQASKLFPGSPTASARFDLSFHNSDSFVLSARGVKITTLDNPNALLQHLLDSRTRGMFQKEFVLVYQVVVVDHLLAILSRYSDTNVQLAANADIGPVAVGDIAGQFTVRYQSNDVLRAEGHHQTAFYNAYRVKESFWTGSDTIEVLGDLPDFFEEV